MNLIVDIGNTRGKIAIFDNGKIIHKTVVTKLTERLLRKLNDQFPELQNAIISSVAVDSSQFLDVLSEQFQFVINLSKQTPLPIKNAYKTPETLGIDRLAAAVGAFSHHPNRPSLIIDMGTAITIDFLNQEK